VPEIIRAAMRSWQYDAARSTIARASATIAARDRLADLAASLGLTPPSGPAEAFSAGRIDVADEELALEEQALTAIGTAEAARIRAPGVIEQLGLVGTDPAAGVRTARAAFEAGNPRGAVYAAADAASAWESATDVGRGRVIGLLAGAAALTLFVRLIVGRGWARQAGWS
jgi:hypothetical protein